MHTWTELIDWLARHPELAVTETLSSLGTDQQTALLDVFQRYNSLAAPPKINRMLEIIGQETNRLILIVAQGLPQLEHSQQRELSINLVLALLRFILLQTPGDDRPSLSEYIQVIETSSIRPMISQGVDQAYPILRQAGLLERPEAL